MIPNSNHLANFHAISISPSSLHFLSPHFTCKFSTKDNFFCKLSYCFMVVSCFSLFYHDLPFFQSCIKSSFFFCNLADHFSSKLLNWAPFRKEWHTKIIFACAIICLVGYLYFYWCNCGESFQRMVYFLHICMIDNGLF